MGIRQTILYRAIRADSISINSILPPPRIANRGAPCRDALISTIIVIIMFIITIIIISSSGSSSSSSSDRGAPRRDARRGEVQAGRGPRGQGGEIDR